MRQAFEDIVPQLAWMDDITKEATLEKAKSVTQKIGYPEYITNSQKLDKHYEQVINFTSHLFPMFHTSLSCI